MSDVEVLRRAAGLMRARAEAAERSWPSPWFYDRGEVLHSKFVPDERAYDRPYVCNADGADADQHIAGMDPAVALAVADWLEYVAQTWRIRPVTERLAVHGGDQEQALAVAYAYLGEG